MKPTWVCLDPLDNVVIVTNPGGMALGDTIQLESGPLKLRSAIPKGHKVAARSIARGQAILKFSHVIGVALVDIAAGEHVHVHNVSMPPAESINSGGQITSSVKKG